MKSKFPTLNGLTPYDNAADGGSARGAFQIFAEKTCSDGKQGAQTYLGSFHSADQAMEYAACLFDSSTDYYTRFNWIQVADMFHGGVWELQLTDKDSAVWVELEGEDE